MTGRASDVPGGRVRIREIPERGVRSDHTYQGDRRSRRWHYTGRPGSIALR